MDIHTLLNNEKTDNENTKGSTIKSSMSKPGKLIQRVRKDDIFYQYLPKYTAVIKYDPEPNGWCAYVALAHALLRIPSHIADHMGYCIKHIMLKCLNAFKDAWEPFFGQSSYDQYRQILQHPITNENKWWIVTPDMLWIAVVAYKRPILFGGHGHSRIQLFHPPTTAPLEDGKKFKVVPAVVLQRHYHLVSYHIRTYEYTLSHHADEQDFLNECFKAYITSK